MAACGSVSDPSTVHYTIPSEEIAVETLRYLVLNVHHGVDLEDVQHAFVQSGSLDQLIKLMAFQTGRVRQLAGYMTYVTPTNSLILNRIH
jgi:hypothetical protein